MATTRRTRKPRNGDERPDGGGDQGRVRRRDWRHRLNAGLDVKALEICVPKYCRLDRPEHIEVERWEELERMGNRDEMWREYVKSLETESGEKCEEKACRTCDYKLGWLLRGNCAVAHSRRVVVRLQSQFLRYAHVGAVDLGFAVLEETRVFENVLALRIHVLNKRSHSLLREAGHPSFTNLSYLFGLHQNPDGEKSRVDAALGKKRLQLPSEISKLLKEDIDLDTYGRYPIAGVGRDDLSWQCGAKVEDCDYSRCRLCICGVPLDIVEAEYFPSAVGHKENSDSGVFVGALQDSSEMPEEEQKITSRCRVNPLVGGISVGSVTGQAGTLGAVVWDRTDGTPCVLSNWHVLAGNPAARVGQPCYQPALFDGGTEADTVAYLKRWHLGELGDAAIAELSGDREYASGEVLGLWNPIAGYETPRLNMEIRKWGRTTGFTEGFIDGLYLATNIEYGQGVVRHFKGQFHIAPLYSGQDVSQVGDSGSLVVTSYKPSELVGHRFHLLHLLRASIDDAGLRHKIEDILTNSSLDERQQVRKLLELHGSLAPQDPSLVHGSETENQESCKVSDWDYPGDSDQLAKFLDRYLPILVSQLRPEQVARLGPASLTDRLREQGLDVEEFKRAKKNREHREEQRVYFAVGLIFAGDTPGSPFGEFALASDVGKLAENLQFSLRPVFEPRTSFRKLRTRTGRGGRTGPRDPRVLEPGEQGADPRGRSPQPDAEPFQTGSGGG